MKKIFAKIIIILALAVGIGRSLVNYTSRWAEYYRTAQIELKNALLDLLDAEPRKSDLDPYLQTPAEQLSGLYNSGIIIGSGNGIDATVLQERLEYYQSNKTELWSE